MAIAVFVVGRNRSGTTWLANQLCEHPKVVGVQHEQHHGITESFYFGYVDVRYGDLSERVNYVEFIEVMASSDFFRLAGASKGFLYSLWPTTYGKVFQKVMDRFAEKNNAVAWVAKSDVQANTLEKIGAFSNSKLIAITRRVIPNVASNLAMLSIGRRSRLRTWAIIRIVMAWAYTEKQLRVFAARSNRMFIIRYEDLLTDTQGTLREVIKFIGVPWDPHTLNQTYKSNTSFKSKRDREKALSSSEKLLILILAASSRLFPRLLWSLIDQIRRPYLRRKCLPRTMFRLHAFFPEKQKSTGLTESLGAYQNNNFG